MTPDLYRLDRTLLGERLIPVGTPEEATHAGIALVQRLAEDRLREVAALQGEVAQLRQRLRALDTQLAHAIHTTDQAQMAAAQRQQEALRERATTQKMATKNAELVGEKRRLRTQLLAKYPPPALQYRIDVDRDDRAHESVLCVLDTFPHLDHAPAALAEARRLAEQRGGHLRQLRLDTVAWRAVVQLPIDG